MFPILRRKRNKVKLMFATAFIVVLRRTAYVLAFITLPFTTMPQVSQHAYADSKDSSFSDIEGHWAEKPILEAVSEGMVSGYEDGSFQPDRSVTRGQFAAMLAASLHIPVAAETTDENVQSAHLQSLRDIGIIDDAWASAEKLDSELYRSEMIRLSLAALDPAAVEPELDKQKTIAAAAGLIDGGNEVEAVADRAVTRAEAVVVLQRLQQAVHPA